jgi:DNA-binding NtrC family response regulator
MAETNANCISVDPQFAMVIDDDVRVGEFIESTLARSGMRVAVYQMAQHALASLDSGRPVLIFLDVALLRSDAIDVLRGLGERRYGGVVQLMSGGRQSLLEAVQRIGVRQGLALSVPLNKPCSQDSIMRVVESLRVRDAARMEQAVSRLRPAHGR